ncbi:MAG: hypothetical protein J6M41_02830 [Prevotella sp.]|nr:hypothetical protein [Prevotella sp.]
MKQESNILRGRMWLMLLVLLAWMVPQQASADDAYETFVDQSILYNVFVSGSNTVTITVPCYDMEGADAWIMDGNLYASWEGQSELNLFHWAADENIDNARSTCPVMFYTQAPGYMNLTLGNTKNVTRLNPHNWTKLNVVRNDDKCTFGATAVWVVPKEMRGKKITLRWHVQRNGNSRDKVYLDEKGGLKGPEPITIAEASPVAPPFVTAANISNDSVGKIMVPWTMIPEKISKLRYEYVDANNRTVSKEVKTTTNSGIITLNATEPHRKFRLIADYYEPQTVGEYLIKDASSEAQDLTMLHGPHGLTVTPLGGATPKVELKWNIGHITNADLAEIDYFEVQRSLTGREEDFVAIGQVPFARIGSAAQSIYTFVDSTYVNDLDASMLTDGYSLENLTYRVRRTMTQAWGWSVNNPCANSARCVVDNLHLLRIANYTATQLDDQYNVRVAWQYADEHNGVWDDRAKMMLRVTLKNAAGDTIDVKEYELNKAEREQCYKVLDLSRTCVKYDIEMYVDRGTSPLNLYDAEKMKDYYFPIRNAQDWTTFRDMVDAAEGKRAVNARLYTDIAETNVYIAWGTSVAYNGVFDGNGHTLTIRTAANERVMAPFRYVGNATIKNLHVAGSIKTSERNISSLIGSVLAGSTVTVENCHSSVTINSTYNGETENGGFISTIGENVKAVLRNCKFDGSFEGDKSHHNGGFIGYCQPKSSAVIDNCLFAPDHINTGGESCETWARTASDATVSVRNSFATMEYSSLLNIRSASDWNKFIQMVKDAKNQYDVNAVLAADITVSDYVGDAETAYYRGIFDGNGHTITFNKSGVSENYIGLFRHAGNATIKNLHVNGTIQTTGQYAGGLIGNVVNGNNVSIETCRSSMTINSTKFTNGGFIARLGDNSTATIRNCKFDGSFEGSESHHNGGFIGYCQDNSTATLENCLFAPDHLDTKRDYCETWARKSDSATVTITNCHETQQYRPCDIMEIDGKTFMVLRNNNDWNQFKAQVESDHNTNAIMGADFDIVSSAENLYGIFDGNGHTLTVNIDGGTTENIALFKNGKDFTIKNLHLAGKVRGANHVAGLVGISNGWNGSCKIYNCRVSATIECTNYIFGGFVGRGNGVDIVNCLFDGKLTCNSGDPWAGVFMGFVDGNGEIAMSVQNCLSNATFNNINHKGLNIRGYGLLLWGNGINQWSFGNWSYEELTGASTVGSKSVSELINELGSNWEEVGGKAVPKMFQISTANPWLSMTAEQQVEALGKDYWEVVDGKAVPKPKTLTDTTDGEGDAALVNLATWTKDGDTMVPPMTTSADVSYSTINNPNLKDLFYHSGTGKIDEQLLAETRQSSVVLTWNTDGNPVDYFIVYRREAGQGDNDWVEIATNLDQMTYEDKTVSPLKNYQYKVRAMTDCEGNQHSETLSADGACKHTGRLEGYVRFNDGTGIADVELTISGGSVNVSVRTDESGHYVADELPYQGQPSITYDVYVGSMVEADVQSYSVTFNGETNDVMVSEFTAVNGRRFSGYVYYEGTNIPVKGVNFLVNGYKLYNASGKLVETDEEGNFSFRVKNSRNTIQVVKNGHTFLNDGQYTNNFTTDVANIRFHDATKVKLVGRVVGGNDQGLLPLGNNLSKNNLGDNLQMVLALEGDTKSWLVQDVQHPERTQRDTVYQHAGGGNHQTKVKTLRKRMEVTPDPATGEYMLMLPPVRWKVQQVYCTGYPTLYQNGQANEVIDLTDCLTVKDTTYVGSYRDVDNRTIHEPKASYNAIYNRIYRSPVELTYKQLSYDTFNYFGDKFYNATNLKGDRVKVPLAYKNPEDTTTAKYTFGHPVFSLERKYYIQVQVAERYPYNNDLTTERIDFVPVGGGKATMHNGLKNGVAVDTLSLDSLGQGTFALQADRVAQPIGAENALRTVTFSAMQDNVHFEAEPLHAYVLNLFPLSGGKELMTDGQPVLFDILRDPPGAYSSSTLAKGATLNNSYSMNLTMAGGLNFNFSVADKLDWMEGDFDGIYDDIIYQYAGSFDGVEHSSEKVDVEYSELVFNYNGSKAWSHTMVLSDAVSTSGDPSMVGADADLYIGQVQNVQVTPLSSISVLTDSVYQSRLAQAGIGQANTKGDVAQYAKYGTLVHIADGVDADGKKFHLVRDVSLGYGPKLKSNFIYSQKQILEQIIPNLAGEIMNHMFIGSKTDAQILANSTHKPVYRSLREPTDPKFALPNKKYNTTVETPNDSTHYIIVLPTGKKVGDFNDEVSDKGEIIYAWSKMITQNEREKLNASELVNSYDIAGAQGVNYSETFSSSYSNATAMYFPYGVQPDYFGGKGTGTISSIASTITNYIGGAIFGYIESFKKLDPTASEGKGSKGKESETSIKFDGKYFRWSLTPVLTSRTIGTSSLSNEYNRTASFTIAAAPTSRLSVDVYRVPMADITTEEGKWLPEDVYSNYNFQNVTKETLDYLRREGNVPQHSDPSSFVFRTRGGVTSNPWEDERKTRFYQAGSILDERTLKVDNPTISLDKLSVSGVSVNDPARFTIFIANESEKPEATGGLSVFTLFSVDQANPNGAKLSVNGQTLTSGGMSVTLVPGVTTQLELEVRAGQGFDYEGLTIGLMSPTDPEHAKATAKFDVHFLREAGAVTISAPVDKWVLNTNAQKDDERGWYIPVTIGGFDRHQLNFDHIEFQYKESQRGDDTWTNICSYYADSTLMAKANGVCELMKPNANIVTEFYGDGWEMERSYDLRAVLFCRNGGTFLTTPSKVVSGIKDTRRPQLFGTPEPKSGLLLLNDDIVFNFSEDIDYNNLGASSHFEVRGEVNNNDISENVSLQFTGQASVETEAKRNFTGKDLTIEMRVNPAATDRDMPLFSHGTNGQKLQLWLTKDQKLRAVVNEETFESQSPIQEGSFRQVAVSISQKDSTLWLYSNGETIGKGYKLNTLYNGTGPLIFGRTNETDRTAIQYYEGRMMEARLWYRTMNAGLVGSYGLHRLTGYEKDLVDYYPMNEGSGDYAIDHTQGANAKLVGANWAMPHGMSLHLNKEDNGLQLTDNAINRSAEQDYTLMFWFKTDAEGRGTLLSNGKGLKEISDDRNRFNIGFEADSLTFRSNGFATKLAGNWSDNQWHHYAMTVNRAHNVANIYMDTELSTTFAADSLGGISGGKPCIGATVDGNTPLKGNVDELIVFGQALPQTLIKTYSTKGPNGDEAGLLTYLSFDHQERNANNEIVMAPYAYSRKLHLDDKGQVRYQQDPVTGKPTGTPVRDYLFKDSPETVMTRIDAEVAAPVVPNENVTNLNFSFIGKGNQIMVELDEPAAKLHHCNIYVTVRDVEDRNGNMMASPKTASYLVTNSSLEWLVNRMDTTIKYGNGQAIDLPFYNWSAKNHTYKIENCPRWLTLNKYTDAMAPQNADYVTATISNDLNVGTYNEIIYLTDEEGIAEPFYLNLTVEGEQPEWSKKVDSDLLRYSMNVIGQVYLYDQIDSDSRDIVGVFDKENVCHGFANITHDEQYGDNALYLTVYDNQVSGRELNFRLWQYSTGRELVLTPKQNITFENSAVVGSGTPVRFDGGESFVQNFSLKKGWNWVSFNVNSPQLADVNPLLNNIPWKEGDVLTDMGSDTLLVYKNKQWLTSGSTQNMTISPKKSYAIKVQEDCLFPIGGTVIKEESARTIEVKKGWNAIGYTPMTNLSVETALSDYYDNAQEGDVIKSHTEFAYFSKSGNVGRWRGSLQYMKPGEGYMMLRKGNDDVSFTYPYYEMGTSSSENGAKAARLTSSNEARSAVLKTRSTMTLSATVENFEMKDGDRLVAYSDGEVVGCEELITAATATDQPVFFMSISGEAKQPIRFTIERDGKTVAYTRDIMTFQTNAVIGSPEEPAVINFSDTQTYEEGKWYTIDGLLLQHKPTQKGVYIFGGKKVVIK